MSSTRPIIVQSAVSIVFGRCGRARAPAQATTAPATPSSKVAATSTMPKAAAAFTAATATEPAAPAATATAKPNAVPPTTAADALHTANAAIASYGDRDCREADDGLRSGAALLVCVLYCLRGLLQTVFGSSGLPCCSKGQIAASWRTSDTGSESDED